MHFPLAKPDSIEKPAVLQVKQSLSLIPWQVLLKLMTIQSDFYQSL